MAETQVASIGWGGEFHLSSDATTGNLYELVQVVSFGLPNDQVDTVETTHLKSANRRREYVAGLVDGGDVQIVVNFRPGSDTDSAIEDAKAGGDLRAARFVVPETGVAAWKYDTTVIVTGYDKGEVTADGKMEATITVRISGAVTGAAVP